MITPAQQKFAANLRKRRAETGLSQREVGERGGINPTEVSRLERHDRNPQLTTLIRLARGLDVEPAELLEGIAAEDVD